MRQAVDLEIRPGNTSKESFVGAQELAVVVATSVSHVLVIIVGVAILVLGKGLWMLGRKGRDQS